MACNCISNEVKDLKDYDLVALSCNHCGGAISQHDEKCSFCSSPLSFVKKKVDSIVNYGNSETWINYMMHVPGMQLKDPLKTLHLNIL